MAKVIVERPRVGSRAPSRKKGYRKFVQRTGIENLPTREPLLGHWRGKGRWLNEHLGPMRRFLRSNVGRPWNKVHQELCEHVCFDNPVQSHVLTHVFDYVHQHVELRGREIVSANGWRRGRSLPEDAMYICPRSGLLKIVRKQDTPKIPRRIGLGQLKQYHWRSGQWWELQLRSVHPKPEIQRRHSPRRAPACPQQTWDVWLEQFLSAEADTVAYGGKLVAVSKRPLTPQETREVYRRLRKLTTRQRTRLVRFDLVS